MRALFICLLLAACDDTSTGVSDLSAQTDLTAATDLTMSRIGCAETEACIGKCTAGNVNNCVPACISQLDPSAESYFNALEGCARPACTQVDGGVGPCADPSSTACQSCVAQKCGSELTDCQAH